MVLGFGPNRFCGYGLEDPKVPRGDGGGLGRTLDVPTCDGGGGKLLESVGGRKAR